MKIRCKVCGQVLQARVPKGGDGSVLRPYAHGGPPGDRCRGSWRDVETSEAFDCEDDR